MVSFRCIDQGDISFNVLESVVFKRDDRILSREGRLVFAVYDGNEWQGELVGVGLSCARGYNIVSRVRRGRLSSRAGSLGFPWKTSS